MLKGALWGGKICTTLLVVSLIIMVMVPNLAADAVNFIFWIDLSFLLIAFADYVIAYFFQPHKFKPVEK